MAACVSKSEIDASTPRAGGTIDGRPVRATGLTLPLHQQQIASWFAFSTFVGTFYGLFLVGLDLAPRIAVAIVYGFLAVLVMFSAATATATDPEDPYSRVGSADGVPGSMYCFRCERAVLGTSKHCTICNKCVDVFDHHCMWLNNCVGKQNIAAFYLLLVSTLLMLTLQVAVGGAYIAVFCRDGYNERVVLYFNDQANPMAVFITVLVVTALCVVTVSFLVQLIVFHAHLLRREMTTYDFIVHRGRGGAADGVGSGSSCSLWMRDALDPQLPPPPPGDGDGGLLFQCARRCACARCACASAAAAAEPSLQVRYVQPGPNQT